MEQFDLFIAPEPHPGSFFSDQQIKALQDISKKLPKIVKFLVADKFDDKFIISKDDIWNFYYSGQRENLDFSVFSENENILLKFFLIAFTQKNSPSFLSRKFYAFKFMINYLINNNLDFSYESLKNLLIKIASQKNHINDYAHIKFLLKLLILEDFPGFNIEDDFELEFIPRPKPFNSRLYYQEYIDPIDYPLITMIQQGFSQLNKVLDQVSFVAQTYL